MDLKEAEDVLAVRLYEWSLRDFHREMKSGCPLLSMVGLNNRRVAAFVAWVNSLAPEERRTLADALVRKAHAYAALLKGEGLTPEDQRYWNHLFYTQTTIRMEQLPPLATADWRLPGFQRADPDHCLGALAASLSPLLGRPVRRRSSVHCTRKVGDWKLTTEFTFSRRDTDLRFEYRFLRKDATPIPGLPFPPHSLFYFWGVYATSVEVPSQQDSEPMDKVMARLAEHFVSQADPLFHGLGLDDVGSHTFTTPQQET